MMELNNYKKKTNKYLVIYEMDGEIAEPVIETAVKIFDKMDMDDCYDIQIMRLVLIDGIKFHYCSFFNTWHDPKDPLRMEIKNMVTNEVYDIGYGTDH